MDGTFLSDQKTYNRERFMAQYQQMKAQGLSLIHISAFCLDVVVSKIAIQRTDQGCVTVRNNDRMSF